MYILGADIEEDPAGPRLQLQVAAKKIARNTNF